MHPPAVIHSAQAHERDKAPTHLEKLEAALSDAVSVISDYLAYSHSGDPWEEDARLMGELEIDEYKVDGRMARALALVGAMEPGSLADASIVEALPSPLRETHLLQQEYRSDPAEDAYYASAEGLRNEARNRRAHASRLLAEADEMESRATNIGSQMAGDVEASHSRTK